MFVLRALVFAIVFYIVGISFTLAVTPALLMPFRVANACKQAWLGTMLMLSRTIIGLTHERRGIGNIPDGPVIFAAKHQSAWDTIALSYIHGEAAVVLKRELTWLPVWGWFLIRLGMVPIDRGKGLSALKRIVTTARRRIAQGRSILIFPQGTRTAPGAKRPYLVGVAAIYAELDLPVVPIALNSGMFWPRRALGKWPGVITVDYLEPIPPGLKRKEFLKTLEARIESTTARLEAEAAERFPWLPPLPDDAAPAASETGGGAESKAAATD